jgi:ATP-dependent RNA helicase RhlE
VLGVANTGTGKTAAFLLPLIEQVLANPKTATVLIIAPVRELAQQIEKELAGFTRGMRIGYAIAIGGNPIGPQIRKLERAPHFVIGTPGRITDLIERGALPMQHFSAVVLDEVDRMLDMGFIDDVRAILNKVPEKRQSLFFSATVSPEISKLIHTFMQDPVTITVKTHATSDNVDQDIVRVGYGMEKIDVLHDLLNKPELEKVLVFGETKRGVERLTKELVTRGFKADAIHGDRSQGQRSRSIEKFKSGNTDILVATDVAARGLDIKGVTHVINYELPQSHDDYAHRIGRTGRAGKKGIALTFVEG